jgi:hypothetical protein
MNSLISVLKQGLFVLAQMRDQMAAQTVVLKTIASSLQSVEPVRLVLTLSTPTPQ